MSDQISTLGVGPIRIGDLLRPVSAAKSNWHITDGTFDFTPRGNSFQSEEQLKDLVSSQAQGGLVLEYISKTIEKPNSGFESDPDYLEALRRRRPLEGRLIAVHRIRRTPRRLQDVLGPEKFEKLQRTWDRSGARNRWSVAFPVIETFAILEPPDAKTLLGDDAYERLFNHQAIGLRPLTDADRAALADLLVLISP
jgi:5-methylcytosine-specific restriction protein A